MYNKKSIIYIFCICLINLVYADQRNFVWTYEKKMLAPGESEFEIYFTSEYPDKELFNNKDNTTLKLQYEFEIGMTDNLEVAFYNTFIQTPDNSFKFDEYKLRFKYDVFKSDNEWAPLFYSELKGNIDFTEYTIEQKLIFTKHFNSFNFSFNPIIEFENEKKLYINGDLAEECLPDDQCDYKWESEIESEIALGLSYSFNNRISSGIDIKSSEYATYIGPVFAHGGEDKYWSFGLMKKIDGLEGKPELIIRSIMGFHF